MKLIQIGNIIFNLEEITFCDWRRDQDEILLGFKNDQLVRFPADKHKYEELVKKVFGQVVDLESLESSLEDY